MIDLDIKEKQIALEKGVQAWQKMKEEISELNAMKSNLVREINIQCIDAKAKADSLISNAQEQAKDILDTANKSKEQIDSYVSVQRKEADTLLHLIKSSTEELKQAQDKLKGDTEVFENLKAGHGMDMKSKTEILLKLEKDMHERQACLDSLEHTIRTNEKQLKEKREEIDNAGAALRAKNDQVNAAQEDLNQKINTYATEKVFVDKQKELNSQVLVDIKDKQDKLAADTNFNQSLADDIARQNIEIAEQKKTINAQFALIENNQRELEEKSTTLDERTQLLIMKEKEIDDKILILQKLRGA
jgi:chlorite dismutase